MEIELVGKNKSLGVGRLPNRKSLAMYVIDGSVISPLAYFKSDEDGEEAADLIKQIALSIGREE